MRLLKKNVSGSFGEVFFDVRCMCGKKNTVWDTWAMEDMGGIRFATWSWLAWASMRYHKSYLSYFQTCKKPLPATPRLFFSRFQVCHASLAARSHLQPLAATRVAASGITSEWPQVAAPENSKRVAASGPSRPMQGSRCTSAFYDFNFLPQSKSVCAVRACVVPWHPQDVVRGQPVVRQCVVTMRRE